MSSPALQLVIDARPRGPRGPLATEVVLGRHVLSHLIEQVQALKSQGQPIVIHAREEEHPLFRALLANPPTAPLTFVTGPPQTGAAILRTDRFYDARRLRRAVRRGQNPETAVLWRLDRPGALTAAETELTRRLTYQPLGHYWAFPLAERLAATLQPTRVRPNAVTLAAAAFMLSAAGLVAFGGTNLPWRITAALALAVALVLDTADGRLARLQGTCSEFGRWLDQVLDELADIALHVAISWSLFQSSREPWWLLLGMLYVSGKYLFQVQSLAGEELEGDSRPAPIRALTRNKGWRSWPRKLVAAVGHADVRWHLWMMLALMGRLDLALMIYTAYFFVRAVGGSLRKVVSHG